MTATKDFIVEISIVGDIKEYKELSKNPNVTDISIRYEDGEFTFKSKLGFAAQYLSKRGNDIIDTDTYIVNIDDFSFEEQELIIEWCEEISSKKKCNKR